MNSLVVRSSPAVSGDATCGVQDLGLGTWDHEEGGELSLSIFASIVLSASEIGRTTPGGRTDTSEAAFKAAAADSKVGVGMVAATPGDLGTCSGPGG